MDATTARATRRHWRRMALSAGIGLAAVLAYAPARGLLRALLLPPLTAIALVALGLAALLVAAGRADANTSPAATFADVQRSATRPLAFATPGAWRDVIAAAEREAGGAGGAGAGAVSAGTADDGVAAALAEAASAPLPLALAAESRAPVPGLDAPAVAARLDSVLGLIRASFVLPWYARISPSRAFPDAVEGVIRYALGAAVRRADDVDWPGLAAARIVPLLTAHLQHYRSVEHLASAPHAPAPALPLPLPPHPHAALTPRHVAPDADIPSIEAHLRAHVNRALDTLLPDKERTTVVVTILREILLGAVVLPLFNMLCEGDFWNRLISEQSAKYLHERKQVNKVLNALSTVPSASPGISPRARRGAAATPSITAHSTTKQFEEFMRSIAKLKTLGEARRLRADVERELRSARTIQKLAPPPDMDKTAKRLERYVHRLERARGTIDRRIVSLSGKKDVPAPIGVGDSPLAAVRAKVTLYTVLADPSCLAYWLEYMDRRSRSHLVQFWLTVEGFKDPLEVQDGLELKTDSGRGMDARTMKDDLAFLNSTYFLSQNRIAVPPHLVETVTELASKEGPLADADVQRGQRAIYETQKAVYAQMEEEDWPRFQKSELYLKVLADLKRSAPRRAARAMSHSPPASPTARLAPPSPQQRRSTDSTRPYIVEGGSFPPVTAATASTTVATTAPDMTRRRLTPEGSSPGSPLPPHRRSANFDELFGGAEPGASERDPLFSEDNDDDVEARRMEAIQAALNEIIADDGMSSRKTSATMDAVEDPGTPESPASPAIPSGGVDPLSMSMPGLIEADANRRAAPYSHPLGGRKITSRSAEDLGAVAAQSSPVRHVSFETAAPAVRGLTRRGSADDGALHKRQASQASIFADDVEADDDVPEDDGGADDPLVPAAAPGDMELSAQIARLDAHVAELRKQDSLLGSLIRQAELTGNQKELRLLRRSHSSLARELRTAEFQAAQYKQQDEDNRLVPGRTRVSIPAAAVGADGQVVRYTVEIAQVADDGRVLLSWTVVHRYSEFWELDRALHDAAVAPGADALAAAIRSAAAELPGKRLVPSTSAGFVEARRAGLERYLRALLGEGALCDSALVRRFLSRARSPAKDQFDLGPPAPAATRLVRTLYRTVASSLDDVGSVPPMLDLMTQGLSRQLADGVAGVTDLAGLVPALRGTWVRDATPPPTSAPASSTDPSANGSGHEPTPAPGNTLPATMQPLGGEGASGSFTAPICDLFIEVFDLKENNWLRRQAIVIILQQVLGGTIERKCRDAFRAGTAPTRVERLLGAFQDQLWPGGVRRQATPPRTASERLDARVAASRRLGMLIPDVAANMIGRGNARRAAASVWGALQDQRLNQHLVLCIFDEIFGAMFPPHR